MATGGFKSTASTDFLEEWKAKREKMRAKMLGDIAAATGTPLTTNTNSAMNNNSNGSPDRSSTSGNCQETSHPAPPVAPIAPTLAPTSAPTSPTSAPTSPTSTSPTSAPTSPTSAPTSPTSAPTACPGGTPKKGLTQTDKVQSNCPGSSSMTCVDGDGKDSPSPSSRGREKKSSGPSARKGKGQIEKRKLREKRRSTGVVSIPSNESLDELDDEDVGEKDRKEEEELVQANTCQNEAMTADPNTGHIMETPRPETGCHKSLAGPGAEDEANGSNRRNRRTRDGASAVASLEKRLEELEKELFREHQENARLLKAHQEKDDLIAELKEDIDLLNRDLDDIEDENDQLKQENKTLLKVVGQLTR